MLLAGSADVALAEQFAVRSLRVLRAAGLGARGGASGREFERVKRIRALPLWQRSCRSATCNVIIIIDRASRSVPYRGEAGATNQLGVGILLLLGVPL